MNLTILVLTQRVWENCVAKGWTERPVPVPEQVALIHSEVTEVLEAWRNNEPLCWDNNGKPDGMGAEFADIVIRVAHYCKLNGIDLEQELLKKMAYNESRPYRHGGKAG